MTREPASPEVTVVVTTLNRRRFLERCVDAVLRQDGVSLELVIVDDASTDDTREWIGTIADSRVQAILLDETSGVSTARNRGLEVACGRFVMFFDDDDWLESGALETLSTGLARSPAAVAAVGARRVWFSEENYARRDSHPYVERLKPVLDDLLVNWSAVPGQYLFRADAVRQVGGFDPTVIQVEDRDLTLRLAALGPFLLVPATVMTYRVHPGQFRPPDLRDLRERVARNAIRRLPAGAQPGALRLRRTSRLLDDAEADLTSGNVVSGAARLLVAVLYTPQIFLSPLIGPWTIRRMGGRLARRFVMPARTGVTSRR